MSIGFPNHNAYIKTPPELLKYSLLLQFTILFCYNQFYSPSEDMSDHQISKHEGISILNMITSNIDITAYLMHSKLCS